MYLGVNHYGALPLDADIMQQDLTYLKARGFTLIRVWPVICPQNKSARSPINREGAFARPEKKDQFDQLVTTWLGNGSNYRLDLSFDIKEFQRVSYYPERIVKKPPFSKYQKAIMTVVNQVASVATSTNHPEFRSQVVIDVANEGVRAGATLSDDDYRGTAFCRLTLDGNSSGKAWHRLLAGLISNVRAKGIEAFFSMLGISDETDVKNAAKYYYQVYGQDFTRRPRAYIAPHFERGPCPTGWASNTAGRISCLYSTQLTGYDIKRYPLYMQEENRRRYECCVPKPLMQKPGDCDPQGDFCDSWGLACSSDSVADDFFKSLKQSRKGNAWGWAFNTDAGFACDQRVGLKDRAKLDAEELAVFNQAKDK